jgi:hypothetical protein
MRGNPELMRRIIHDLQLVYLPRKNKKTGKKLPLIQLMPREMKTFEVVFPEEHKDQIQDIIKNVAAKHNLNQVGGVSIHWGPTKKDKFDDGVERL